MPALVAFGRKWGIGSDDFVFPGILEIFTRFIWLTFVFVIYIIYRKELKQCQGGSYLEIYSVGLLVLMFVCIIMSIIIVIISSRGTITNTRPRRYLSKVIYVKTFLAVVEAVWNSLGTYWTFRPETSCKEEVELSLKITVILFWLLAVVVSFAFLIVFGVLGGKKKKRLGLYSDDNGTSLKSKWEKRFKKVCFWLAEKDKNIEAFKDIAEILADFFPDVDMVATDVAAGLILVNKDQEQKMSDLPSISYETFTSTSTTLEQVSQSEEKSPLKPKAWMTVEIMQYYMKYANASYGWPRYILSNISTGICYLWKHLKCCCHTPEGHIVYDNCCMCHTATIRTLAKLEKFDLVYADYHNNVFEIPFYVAIDKEKQTVVVAIRGTLSIKDAITDLNAQSEEITVDGIEGCLAHKGILQSAQYVKKTLEENHILEKAFDRVEGDNLVLTGHSLGAGAAALLAMLLKPSYPNIKCIAFCPPGGLMSYEASLHTQDYVCSVVYGKDLVPRLSMWSMYDLKEKTLTAVKQSNSPKFKILASGMWDVLCSCSGDDVSTERLLGKGGSNVQNTDLETALDNINVTREELKKTCPQMYPPGQILHILEMEDHGACTVNTTYYAEWARVEDVVKEVIISSDMISHHSIENLEGAFDYLNKKNFTPRMKNTGNLEEATEK